MKLYAAQSILGTALTIAFNLLFLIPMKLGVTGYVLSVAVADAVPALDEFAHWRLKTPGGCGVFVEILERLFRESGIWDEVLERYRK
jgi:hypothetical protein